MSSPKLCDVGSKYGAPMGRNGCRPLNFNAPLKFYLRRVPLNSGGYDSGGAYWGLGSPLYYACSVDEVRPHSPYGPPGELRGARVARVDLGIGLERLLKAGARFDLIVCDIPQGSQCAAVGAFAPPPALYAPGVRRILGCTPPAPKPPARVGLAVSVFTAIQALLADNGEALVRVPVADCDAINSDSKLLKYVWWSYRHGSVADGYLRRAKKIRKVSVRPDNREPNATDRRNMFGPESGRPWTPGQMQIFKETLLEHRA